LFEDDQSGPLLLIPQGTLPWKPIKVEKSSFFGPISFVTLQFQNGLQYRNSNFKTVNRMNFSTLYTILVTFGPVSPEIARVTTAPFWMKWQKSA